MSYKNILQEYCQKKGYPLPVYDSYIISGEDHAPRWDATVTVLNISYQSAPKPSKREAEQDAAYFAYCRLTTGKSRERANKYPYPQSRLMIVEGIDAAANTAVPAERVVPIENTIPTDDEQKSAQTDNQHVERVVFIDLENVQPNPSVLHKTIGTNIIMYGFHSTYSTIDVSKYEPYMSILSIDSPVTEAADHLLTYTIGKLIGSRRLKSDVHVSIVSRDKASAIIVHLLELEDIQVVHFKSARDFEESL